MSEIMRIAISALVPAAKMLVKMEWGLNKGDCMGRRCPWCERLESSTFPHDCDFSKIVQDTKVALNLLGQKT